MEITSITKDTIAYGKRFYWAVNFPSSNPMWIRFDTTTGNLYRFNSNNSCSYYDHQSLIDSLWSGFNDSVKYCLSATEIPKCSDTSYLNIFGKLRQKKVFDINCSYPPYSSCSVRRLYIDSIGMYGYIGSSSGGGGFSGHEWQLRGTILNGVVYGDTSLIGLSIITTDVPLEYSLSQNYPNPFNPVTNIKFDIPKQMMVKIAVYDIIGKEISVLANEEMNAGSYSVDWDASNYPSGVYFYKITAGVYSESKKMVLVK